MIEEKQDVMKASLIQKNNTTLSEWANFFSTLNQNNKNGATVLKKAESPMRIVSSLEKEFSKIQQPAIFRRLGKHTQLVLQFS